MPLGGQFFFTHAETSSADAVYIVVASCRVDVMHLRFFMALNFTKVAAELALNDIW